jgi:hypothetical protein
MRNISPILRKESPVLSKYFGNTSGPVRIHVKRKSKGMVILRGNANGINFILQKKSTERHYAIPLTTGFVLVK